VIDRGGEASFRRVKELLRASRTARRLDLLDLGPATDGGPLPLPTIRRVAGALSRDERVAEERSGSG
jgi:hypothetical protein